MILFTEEELLRICSYNLFSFISDCRNRSKNCNRQMVLLIFFILYPHTGFLCIHFAFRVKELLCVYEIYLFCFNDAQPFVQNETSRIYTPVYLNIMLCDLVHCHLQNFQLTFKFKKEIRSITNLEKKKKNGEGYSLKSQGKF